jgi:hypothetical protein
MHNDEHKIDGLLTLARSEGGLDNRQPCDLAQITERVSRSTFCVVTGASAKSKRSATCSPIPPSTFG